MAKDRNGRELRVGDTVVLHGVVHSMRRDDDAANLTIETTHPALGQERGGKITLSALQVEKDDTTTGEPKQSSRPRGQAAPPTTKPLQRARQAGGVDESRDEDNEGA
jgi:hypothetical protein